MRSGYRIVDILSFERRIVLRRGVEIEKIIVFYVVFGGGDVSFF